MQGLYRKALDLLKAPALETDGMVCHNQAGLISYSVHEQIIE